MKMRIAILVLLALMLMLGGIPSVKPSVARPPVISQAAFAKAGNASSVDTSHGFWQNWTPPIDVSQCPANRATYATLGVTSGEQPIYLAWTDGRSSHKDIYYAASTDGGWHWAAPQPVVATAADSWRPSLVMSGTTSYLAWAEATSPLNRDTYQLALGMESPAIVPNEHPVLAYAPRLAQGPGGELHLALQGGLVTQPDILYSRRSAGATAWPTATVVFTHTASGSYNPAIAVGTDGQSVHLVWQENISGDQSAIYYLKGERSGEDVLWEAPMSLSEGITRSVRPAIALWSESEISHTVYVAWGEQTEGFEAQYIRYSRSDDGGAHWSSPSRVDSEPVSANNVAPTDVAPALAVTPSGAPCVAWHGFRSGVATEAEEIYLTCSSDQGESWGTPVNVSRSPGLISIRPVLAIGSDGILNVAWQELAGSDADPVMEYQIYYARSLPYSAMLPLVRR